ncbi:unnamed protein product [Ectocarpus fasciculatus]
MTRISQAHATTGKTAPPHSERYTKEVRKLWRYMGETAVAPRPTLAFALSLSLVPLRLALRRCLPPREIILISQDTCMYTPTRAVPGRRTRERLVDTGSAAAAAAAAAAAVWSQSVSVLFCDDRIESILQFGACTAAAGENVAAVSRGVVYPPPAAHAIAVRARPL